VSETQEAECIDGNHIILKELQFVKTQRRKEAEKPERPETKKDNSIFTITKDGVYVFGLRIESMTPDTDYNASVHLEIKSLYGYLSAADYPLLPVGETLKNPGPWMLISFFPVLRRHVHCVRHPGRDLADRVVAPVARSASNPVLDRWRHISGHVGKGGVLFGVPDH
jgi:hypothetical protein